MEIKWQQSCAFWNLVTCPLKAQHITESVCLDCVLMAGGGIGSMSMDRMGSSLDRMAMSAMDMNRSFSGYGPMGGGLSDRGSGSKAGCQIFVRNVSLALNAFMTTQTVFTSRMTETVHKRWKVYTQQCWAVIYRNTSKLTCTVWTHLRMHTYIFITTTFCTSETEDIKYIGKKQVIMQQRKTFFFFLERCLFWWI